MVPLRFQGPIPVSRDVDMEQDMAKSEMIRSGLYLSLCTIAVYSIICAVVLADEDASNVEKDTPPVVTKPVGTSAQRLYADATGLGHQKLPDRVDAAKRLVAHPDGGPWVALLLVSSQNVPTGDKMEQERQAALRTFDLGVVAVALKAMPKHIDTEVLWALTYLLNETERGKWSEETGIILRRKSDHSSPPIRELARTCLKDRDRSHHEWDATAWRTAILRLERPSTQPAAPSEDRKATPEPD